MKRPAFQFYPADWRKDVELQSCSMAAQGLWINAMCVAHECEPYGHLTVNGRGMSAAQFGRQVGLSPRETQGLLDELHDAGVIRRTPEGVYFSKRMVDDEDLRNRRAAGGAAGAEHGAKGAESGIKGGRPKVGKGGSETPLHGETKPPPSSSSSSSPSGEETSHLKVAPARPLAEAPPLALVGSKPEPPDCPHQEVLALWAEVLPSMPQHLASQWKGARADHLRVRWRETAVEKGWPDKATGLDYFRKLFGYVGRSAFLTGRAKPIGDKRPFVIELEWLVLPTNWAKVIEGKYHQEAA